MKSITLFTAVVFLLFVAISCKDDDSTPETETPLEPNIEMPSIAVTVPGLTITDNVVNISVKKDSTITIGYVVAAEGGIQHFAQTVDGVKTDVDVNGEEELSGELIVNIPFEDATIALTMEVKDAHDQVATATISIVVKTIGPKHGDLRAVVVAGAGTKPDYNDGNYTFAGYRHMHHRSTDFENASTPVPQSNTKAGWQAHLDGIFPIKTSDDFNDQSVASGATLQFSNGPTPSGKWLRKQSSDAIKALFPSNHRLRNWNLFSNNSGFKPAVYVSFYVQTFVGDDTGKLFRMYWRRDVPTADPKYSTSFWVGKSPDTYAYTWRMEWSGDGEPGGYGDQQFEIDGEWNRVELIFDFVNDMHAILINGIAITDVSRSYTGIIEDQIGTNSIVTYALLGNTVDPTVEDGHHLGWAQPYADFSLQRIEIADSPNWQTKTKSVIQPVKSWTSDNIEFIINQGDFDNLTDKHIFYLNGLDATYIGAL